MESPEQSLNNRLPVERIHIKHQAGNPPMASGHFAEFTESSQSSLREVPTDEDLVHQPHQFPCDTSDAIIDSMAQLIVRNLDEEIVTRLRQRAAKHRRSTEAEHREILREVLLPPRSRSSLKEHLLAMPDAGTDRDFERPPDRPRKRVKL